MPLPPNDPRRKKPLRPKFGTTPGVGYTPPAMIILAVCLALAGCLSGCAAFRTLMPGGATMADAEWDGVKGAQPVAIVGTLDERTSAAFALLQALGSAQEDPFGVLLPLTPIGATEPRWVLCTGKFAKKAREIPLQATVHFAGRPLGPGILWQPSRLTATHFDD